MDAGIVNFAPGPSYVDPKVQKEYFERGFGIGGFCDTGIPIDGISHRSPIFLEEVLNPLNELTRKLLKIPDNYSILWTRDGATEQWSRIARNFNYGYGSLGYVDTGDFAKRAIKAYDTISTGLGKYWLNLVEFKRGVIPLGRMNTDLLHITWNNTVEGIEFKDIHLNFYAKKHTLIVDATSNIFSRDVLWDEHNIGMIYASTTKQMGGAGNCLIIIRDDLIALSKRTMGLSDSDSYAVMVEKDSGLYTSNVEGLLKTLITLEFYDKCSLGVKFWEKVNSKKAKILYDVIDGSNGLYRGYSHKSNRSSMNVVFFVKSKKVTRDDFLKEAEKEGLMFLKGHKILPNSLRASIYNMMPVENVERLAQFMRKFQEQHA